MKEESSTVSNLVFDFLSESASAKSKDDVLLLLGKISQYFGFSYFAISESPRLRSELIPISFWAIGQPGGLIAIVKTTMSTPTP